jgi:hypothetical protein
MGSFRFRAAAVALTVAFILSFAFGCGGEDGPEENAGGAASLQQAEGPPETKAEFVKRADAVCEESSAAAEKAYERVLLEETPVAPDEQNELRAEVGKTIYIPSFQDQVDALRDMGAPPGDETAVRALTDAMQNAVDEARKAPAALLQRIPAFDAAVEWARQYGVTACAQSFEIGA